MKLTHITIAAALAITGMSAQAQSGPFGLKIGAPLAEIRGSVPDLKPTGNPVLFYGQYVPKPYSEFSLYALNIDPIRGLCSVLARTKDDMYIEGRPLLMKFDGIYRDFIAKYGEPDQKVLPTDITRMLQAIYDGKQSYVVTWDRRGQEGIQKIELMISATSRVVGAVQVMYRSPWYEECEQRRAKESRSGL